MSDPLNDGQAGRLANSRLGRLLDPFQSRTWRALAAFACMLAASGFAFWCLCRYLGIFTLVPIVAVFVYLAFFRQKANLTAYCVQTDPAGAAPSGVPMAAGPHAQLLIHCLGRFLDGFRTMTPSGMIGFVCAAAFGGFAFWCICRYLALVVVLLACAGIVYFLFVREEKPEVFKEDEPAPSDPE